MTDLAKLVVRLEAETGKYAAKLDAAEKKLGQFAQRTDAQLSKIDKRFAAVGNGVRGALAAFAGFVSLRAIVSASAEAAKNFALLENAVQQAGAAAGGRSAKNFADVSEQLQNITTFSDDSIQSVQQLLLRFQSIDPSKFDKATKSVLNLATALGKDAESSATLLGKALADPEKGMTALAKAGVIFSDSQKKVIKDLADTGRLAEAQGIILDELEKRFGGAAEAARNNFSGALQGLKNDFDNLLEVDSGLPGATQAINDLSKVLQDPATKRGADSLFSGIITGAAKAAEFVAKLAGGIAVLAGGGADEQVNLDDRIRELTQDLARPRRGPNAAAEREEIKKTIATLTELYNLQAGLGKEGIYTARTKAPGAVSAPGGAIAEDVTAQSDAMTKALEKQEKAAAKLREQFEASGKALTENLQTPLEKYNAAVDKADKLLAAHLITEDTWVRALASARGELEGLSTEVPTVFADATEMANKFDESLQMLDESSEKLFDTWVDADMADSMERFDEMMKPADEAVNKFLNRAIENVQDVLANGIEDSLKNGFDEGAKGILEGMRDLLYKLVAQALAAKVGQAIFGSDGAGLGSGGGAESGGGWWGSIAKVVGSLFAGTRDLGGRGSAGSIYEITPKVGSEYFVPDTAGQFITEGQMGGGMNVNQNFYIDAPAGTVSRQTQTQIGASAARGLSQANRRNN